MDFELAIQDDQPKRDLLWEAMLDACDVDVQGLTSWARGRYNKSLAQLRHVRATPEDIRERAGQFRQRFPHSHLSPSRLCQKWPELKPRREPGERSVIVRDGEIWQQGVGWSKT